MAVSQEIKDRIFAAADALYAESQSGEYPVIEAVRQASKAGMANVMEAMKEWRENQRKQVQVIREPLPLELHGAVQSLGHAFWETAQELANESLNAARIAFDTEKSDLIQLSAEQSAAYEVQANELDMTNAEVRRLEEQLSAAAEKAQEQERALHEAGQALAASEQRAAVSEQKAQDMERRAEDAERRAVELRHELDGAHTERDKALARLDLATEENGKLAGRLSDSQIQVVQLQAAIASAEAKAVATEQAHGEQLKRATEEVQRSTEVAAKAETARDQAREEAATARESSAALRGELEATKTQNVALLAALKPNAKTTKPSKD